MSAFVRYGDIKRTIWYKIIGIERAIPPMIDTFIVIPIISVICVNTNLFSAKDSNPLAGPISRSNTIG